jgi:hypothetical protein
VVSAPQLDDEIRALRRSLEALKAAANQAVRAREETNSDLAHVQRRLAAKTAEALPGDDDIRKRLDAAIDSAFTAARQALTARWTEIVTLLTTACAKVDEEIRQKERQLAQQREDAAHRQRQEQRQTTLAAGRAAG